MGAERVSSKSAAAAFCATHAIFVLGSEPLSAFIDHPRCTFSVHHQQLGTAVSDRTSSTCCTRVQATLHGNFELSLLVATLEQQKARSRNHHETPLNPAAIALTAFRKPASDGSTSSE